MKKFFILILLLLWGCEGEYSRTNYKYSFQAKIQTDEWGIQTWGGHLFTTNEKIEDIQSFKKCYVGYLKWSGKDVDGLYNRLYWEDTKNIKIVYDGTTSIPFTNVDINNCND
jgi:hypothetical protein